MFLNKEPYWSANNFAYPHILTGTYEYQCLHLQVLEFTSQSISLDLCSELSKICLTGVLLRNILKYHCFCPAPKYNRVERHPFSSWKAYLFGLPDISTVFPFVTQIPRFQKFQSKRSVMLQGLTRIAMCDYIVITWITCNYMSNFFLLTEKELLRF